MLSKVAANAISRCDWSVSSVLRSCHGAISVFLGVLFKEDSSAGLFSVHLTVQDGRKIEPEPAPNNGLDTDETDYRTVVAQGPRAEVHWAPRFRFYRPLRPEENSLAIYESPRR